MQRHLINTLPQHNVQYKTIPPQTTKSVVLEATNIHKPSLNKFTYDHTT